MKFAKDTGETERLAFALGHLKEILLRQMPKPGIFTTEMPDVGMARRDAAGFSEHRFDRPLVSLLAQGSKETVIGGSTYKLNPLDLLTVCVDMPSSSRILEASPEAPLLTFYFYLNPAIIKELLLELDYGHGGSPYTSGVMTRKAETLFMETMLQLATVITGGNFPKLKASLLIKYLHFLVLSGEKGELIRNIYTNGARNNSELFGAIKYLRENLDRVVSAKELANAANMSESSLYRHFKSLIGISPLQYHKQLRLHKARELIIAGQEPASIIAYKVGYESVSQFSREYKKMFGLPPKRSNKH